MKLGFKSTGFKKASSIAIPDIFYNRLTCGVREFDEIFGSGILPGCSATFTGSAGTGKTTFLLQFLDALADAGYNVGYASGEENQFQLAFTCKRLGVKNVQIANETDIDTLAAAMDDMDVLVIDSFQALSTKTKMNSRELESYAVNTLCNKAKESECALFFVMHLTKDGKLKGSTLVPHSVDVNIQLTHDQDSEDESGRVIDVYKNRFGATGEFSATLTAKGYELTGRKANTRSLSKSQRKAQLHNQILELDPPNITQAGIMDKFKLSQSQAYVALKELTDAGKLVKYGRGKSSVWKKTTKATAN